MFRNSPRITLRGIVILFITLFVCLFFWYVLTHGRLVTPTATEDSIISYSRLEDGLRANPSQTVDTNSFVMSGTYSVSIADKHGNRSISNVEVPRLLMGATVQKVATPRLVSTLARNSLSNLLYTSRGLSSYEGLSFRQLEPENITNDDLKDYSNDAYPDFIESKQINRQTIVGFERTSAGVQPIRYDAVTNNVMTYPLLSTSRADEFKAISLYTNHDRFSLFNKRTAKLTTYGTNVGDVTTISLKNTGDISEYEGRPVIDVSDTSFAVATGPDFVSSNDNAEELEDGDHDVRIFSLADKKKVTTLSFGTTPILSVSLSPSADIIAISSSTQTGFYDIASQKIRFIIPHSVEDMRWLDKNRFVARSQLEGIIVGDITSMSAQTMVSYDDVRPTEVSFIEGNQVFFTGYSEVIPNAEYPDAYKVDISKPHTENSMNGLREFPYQGQGYYVDYLSGIATIRLTRYDNGDGTFSIDEQARRNGITYVQSKLEGYPVSNIRYSYATLSF